MASRRGPDGSARIAISGTNSGLPFANVFWANLIGGSNATQAGFNAWVSSFSELYSTAWAARMSTNVQILQGAGTLFQPNNNALHSFHTMAHAGTNATAMVQNTSSCAVVSWTTNAYWRGGKPRSYFPGLVQTDVINSQDLTAAAITAWNNAADTWITGVNALNATGITQTQYGFVSFESDNAPRPVALFFPITGHAVHSRLGTQRRRLGKWTP